MILHQSSSATITLDPLTENDAAAVAELLWSSNRDAMPDGMANTHQRMAWWSVVAGALAWGDIALGMRVNGGAISGVAIARPDTSDQSRMLLIAAVSNFDSSTTLPLILSQARIEAQRRGRVLMRRRTETRVVYDEV
jgi:hypothetical protein